MSTHRQAFIQLGVWGRAMKNFRRILRLSVDGGSTIDLPGGGQAFQINERARVHPFQVTRTSAGVIVEAGLVFYGGSCFYLPRRHISTGAAPFLVGLPLPVDYDKAEGDTPSDPWTISISKLTSLAVEVRFITSIGADAVVKDIDATSTEVISVKENTVFWPIAMAYGGAIIQNVTNHLVFDHDPNGRITLASGYPQF